PARQTGKGGLREPEQLRQLSLHRRSDLNLGCHRVPPSASSTGGQRPRLEPQQILQSAATSIACGPASSGWRESVRRSANKPRAVRTFSCAPLARADQRNDLKAARTSVEKSSGSSHAAKWPPRSTSFK